MGGREKSRRSRESPWVGGLWWVSIYILENPQRPQWKVLEILDFFKRFWNIRERFISSHHLPQPEIARSPFVALCYYYRLMLPKSAQPLIWERKNKELGWVEWADVIVQIIFFSICIVYMSIQSIQFRLSCYFNLHAIF